MKSMHSLTKPINIFPTIPEYEILHDHNNCKNIIMSLDLPDELKITNNILNIYTNTDKSLFYFKINNIKQYVFQFSSKKTSFDLITFILNTLSEYVGFSIIFDLILTNITSVDTIKHYLKLSLNEIYFTKGNIITM